MTDTPFQMPLTNERYGSSYPLFFDQMGMEMSSGACSRTAHVDATSRLASAAGERRKGCQPKRQSTHSSAIHPPLFAGQLHPTIMPERDFRTRETVVGIGYIGNGFSECCWPLLFGGPQSFPRHAHDRHASHSKLLEAWLTTLRRDAAHCGRPG